MRLMEEQELTPRQLALECELPLKWVKRACEGGLDRLYVRNKEKLGKLASFLGLSDAREFWRESPFTDLPTEIRDHWKELAGSPFDRLIRKELESCRNVCRDLMKCHKVYELIRQMPEGEELAEIYLHNLSEKVEWPHWKSIEDEANYQHGLLLRQRDVQNLISLLERVSRMDEGESVVESIQRDLGKDEDRDSLNSYARGSHTMREFWRKVIDIHGEEYAADWLYQTYSQEDDDNSLQRFFSALKALDPELASMARQRSEITDNRVLLLKKIKKLGIEDAAQAAYETLSDESKRNSEDTTEQQSNVPGKSEDEKSEDIVAIIRQEFPVEWPLFLREVYDDNAEAATMFVREKWQEAYDQTGGTVSAKDFAKVFYAAHLKHV